MNRIALTGGSGFIGRYISERLMETNPEFSAKNLDLEAPQFQSCIEHLPGDVRDRAAADRLCENVDLCIHLAAAHRDFGIEREEYFDVNETGTRVLLQAMDANNVRNLVFTSTVAVYDPDATEINEHTNPDPQNHYGASKLAAEKVIEEWIGKGEGRKALVLRPTVVIGPRNRATMYSLIDQIQRGKYVFNMGNGNNVKSLAIVTNLVKFILEKATSDGWEGLVTTNFVDAPQMPTREIIAEIHRELNKKMPKITVPLSAAAAMALPIHLMARAVGKHSPITPARIRKLGKQTRFDSVVLPKLGYQPGKTTKEGLCEMVQWYLTQNK